MQSIDGITQEEREYLNNYFKKETDQIEDYTTFHDLLVRDRSTLNIYDDFLAEAGLTMEQISNWENYIRSTGFEVFDGVNLKGAKVPGAEFKFYKHLAFSEKKDHYLLVTDNTINEERQRIYGDIEAGSYAWMLCKGENLLVLTGVNTPHKSHLFSEDDKPVGPVWSDEAIAGLIESNMYKAMISDIKLENPVTLYCLDKEFLPAANYLAETWE